MRAPVLVVALILSAPLFAAPLEAQYRQGVLVYDSQCLAEYPRQLRSASGVALTVNDHAYGVRSLGSDSRVELTMQSTQPGATLRRITTMPQLASALYTSVLEGSICDFTLRAMSTDSLVTWARGLADNADLERRRWGRIRNLLFLGGAAVVGATVYNFNNELERDGEGDALTLVLGTTLGFTIGYLGFNQAQPEVAAYTAQRDRYRNLERWILEQSR